MTLHKHTLLGSVAVGAVFAAGLLALTLTDKNVEAPRAPTAPTIAATQEPAASDVTVAEAVAQITQANLRADLEKIYAENKNRLLWTDGRASRKRLESIDDVVGTLASQGLDAAPLYAAKAAVQNANTDDERVRADLAMSAALLKVSRGQRFGFISASDLGWNLATDDAELASSLGESATKNNIPKFFDSLRPRDAQFKGLTDALERYRTFAAAGGWPTVPDGKEIDFTNDTRLPVLRERLVAEGYLSARENADGATLQNAVKVFQSRNGLTPDGRAGRSTLAALNVSAEERVGQIVANLERLRHMRHEMPEEYILANVADQSVVVMRDGREDLRLRTVVGTRRHATPMLEATMTAVTVNPPWEIPTSIITKEILPKLDKEPDYLIDNDMEVVSGSWDNPKSLRLRQRPGVGNSLGHMKFQMQNQWNIYLHDTPSRALFAKDDRYFSHGCVRVHQPHELAMNLLRNVSAEDINQMIAAGATKTMKLEKPLPVFVLYWTVFTDKEGQLHFRRDAYDRDTTTVTALTRAGVIQQKSEVVQSGN